MLSFACSKVVIQNHYEGTKSILAALPDEPERSEDANAQSRDDITCNILRSRESYITRLILSEDISHASALAGLLGTNLVYPFEGITRLVVPP